jgi:hypothetical protein
MPGVKRKAMLVNVLGLSAVLGSGFARAGPPYLTDDPEPVELGHWEFYAASQWSVDRGSASGTLPHIEVNYGALPELQLHVIVPAVLAVQSGAPTQYGLGDIELGAKYRFVDEGERRPQIGTFPLVELPTGSAVRGLGYGHFQLFLPIWVQKSFGGWTTYGGGGVRIASGERDGVVGWLLQRQLADSVSLGGEGYLTVPLRGSAVELQLNLGAVLNVTSHHHVLVSGGPAFGAGVRAQAYLAYQLTI